MDMDMDMNDQILIVKTTDLAETCLVKNDTT